MSKIISNLTEHVITAIVNEDQLALAIGRNGQNVRLASQLIGWQLDLYSSRDWMERGGQSALFSGVEEYEMSDFPLSQLDGIAPVILSALEAAGISSFYGVLDMDRKDFIEVPGIGPEEADQLEALIDELTVIDNEIDESADSEKPGDGEVGSGQVSEDVPLAGETKDVEEVKEGQAQGSEAREVESEGQIAVDDIGIVKGEAQEVVTELEEDTA